MTEKTAKRRPGRPQKPRGVEIVWLKGTKTFGGRPIHHGEPVPPEIWNRLAPAKKQTLLNTGYVELRLAADA